MPPAKNDGGAQRLAKAGVTEAQVRLFGRWASRAMLEYVRDALLAEDGVAVAKEVEERTTRQEGNRKASSSTNLGSVRLPNHAKWPRRLKTE